MSIISLGEILIDFVPDRRGVSLQRVDNFKKRFGGAPANVAIGLSRLNQEVYFVGQVGDDAFGRFLGQKLQQNEVKTDFLQTTQQAPTTLAFVSLEKSGERDFIFYRNPGADVLLSRDVLQEKLWMNKKILTAGSVSLSSGPAAETTREALKQAQSNGLITCFDINYRHFLWEKESIFLENIADILANINLLKMNFPEFKLLGSHFAPGHFKDKLLQNNKYAQENIRKILSSVCSRLLARGPDLIVVTFGAKGSYYQRKSSSGFVNSEFSCQALDTTGAGDAFMAVLVNFIEEKFDEFSEELNANFLEKALFYANKAGALAVTEYGAASAFPDKEKLFQEEI